MRLLDIIHEHAQKAELSFLLAGGHAVNAYVTGRHTGDVDLVVPDEERISWKNLISHLGYTVHFEHKSFLQFKPPEMGWWPLDLILVSFSTFQAMSAEAVMVNFGGKYSHPTASPRHLIAMKCHAAKEPNREDPLKDIRDIMELAKHLAMAISSEEFSDLCLKYGNEKLLRKIRSLI